MSATLLLTRPFRMADAALAYRVLLDEEVVGKIRNHSRAEIPISAGEHTLQIFTPNAVTRRPGRGSRVVSFEVGDDDAATFACRCPRYPRASFHYIACVLGDPDGWIELERAR